MPLNEGLVFTTDASARPIVPRRTNERRGDGVVLDTATSAFISAASISNPTIISALDTKVKALKSQNLWAKLHASYPLVGGTALAHSINLRDPGTFQIVWSGTLTHDANGVTGSAGSGDTGYNPSTHSVLQDNHLSVYVRNALPTSIGVEIGCNVVGSEWGIQVRASDGNTFFMLQGSASEYPPATLANNLGLITATRDTPTTIRGFQRGAEVLASSLQTQTTLPNKTVRLLSTTNAGDSAFVRSSVANLAGATIGLKLTAAEVAALNTIEQAFQTTLGRQV